uniref:Uncharacterized protein n=1 Tax=Anguilla anguilla TaxID=7936 RepID=A0A0E9W0T0_ANGAN
MYWCNIFCLRLTGTKLTELTGLHSILSLLSFRGG